MKGKIFNKKLLKIGTVLLIVVCSFSLIFSIPVSAVESKVYSVNIQKPQTNEYSGYVEFLISNGSYSYVSVYSLNLVWSYVADFSSSLDFVGVTPRLNVTFNNGEFYLNVDFLRYSSQDYFKENFSVILGSTSSSDNTYTVNTFNTSSLSDPTFFLGRVYDYGNYKISGVRSYGAVSIDTSSFGSVFLNQNWTVTYGSDTAMYNSINSFKQAIQSNNQQIIDNANQNASDIQANQDKNTTVITQGGKDYDALDDSTANDFTNAEQEALGGKTDAQIQAEVNDVLNGGTSGLDFTKANRISNFFNDCMSAFGIETLVLFSLCMGLGAFIIGRRYG